MHFADDPTTDASSSPDSYFNIASDSSPLDNTLGIDTPSLTLDTSSSALEQQSLSTTQLTDPTASGIFSSQGNTFDQQASSPTSGGAFSVPGIASALGLGPALPGAKASSPLIPIAIVGGLALLAWFLMRDS